MNHHMLSQSQTINVNSNLHDEFESLLQKYDEYYYSCNNSQNKKIHFKLHTNPYDHNSHNHHHHEHHNDTNHIHDKGYYEQFIEFIESIYDTITDFFKPCFHSRGINNKQVNPYEKDSHKYLMFEQFIEHVENVKNNEVINNDGDEFVIPIIYKK